MTQLKWVLVLAGLPMTFGCEPDRPKGLADKVTPADVRRDVGEADKTTATYVEQTKHEYQQQLETRLKELDAEIARLRDKGRELTGDAKAEWERALPELQAKRDSAHAKLAEVRQSSAEAWLEVKKGAQSAWDDLDRAFHDASKKF